jgi:hypothetical protein
LKKAGVGWGGARARTEPGGVRAAVPWAWGGSQIPIVLQLTMNIVGFGLDPLSDANRTAIKEGMDQILSGTGG